MNIEEIIGSHSALHDASIIERLAYYGHFHNPASYCEPKIGDLRKLKLTDREVKDAILSYQLFMQSEFQKCCKLEHDREGISDGECGPATRRLLSISRCGCPDYFPESNARFSNGRLSASIPVECRLDITVSWRMKLSGIGDALLDALYPEAWSRWEKHFSDIRFSAQQSSFPNTRIAVYKESLQSGVLADQQLPMDSCTDNLRGRVADRIWSSALLLPTVVHELGHALGAHHVNDSIAVMYPAITQTSIHSKGELTPADVKHVASLGYLRASSGPHPPPTSPTEDAADTLRRLGVDVVDGRLSINVSQVTGAFKKQLILRGDEK